MHKIDIHNYEAYLLDFSEGNLSDECQMELELFLIQHPELNIDLSELSLVALENEPVNFLDKYSLKKSESDLVSETQFIGYIENQLSIEEKLNIEKSCATNPSLAKDLKLYNSTIVKANIFVVYENKESLKRKSRVIWFNFSATKFAAAASVLFLIGLFIFWLKTETTISNSQLADKTIKEASVTKIFIANNSTNHKSITTETLNAKEKNILSSKKSVISNSQLALKKLIVTSQNKNTASVFKDSIDNLVKNSSVIENTKKEIFIAQNSPSVLKENKQSVVEVITENDDETITLHTSKKKRSVWEIVSTTLKNLNHIGLKSVNGDEENNKGNTAYALTLGGVSITHKAGL